MPAAAQNTLVRSNIFTSGHPGLFGIVPGELRASKAKLTYPESLTIPQPKQ